MLFFPNDISRHKQLKAAVQTNKWLSGFHTVKSAPAAAKVSNMNEYEVRIKSCFIKQNLCSPSELHVVGAVGQQVPAQHPLLLIFPFFLVQH